MLSGIKFDFQADNPEDLEYFKTLFVRNVGIGQMMYDFYSDNVLIRLQISGTETAQLVGIGFFHYKVEGKSTSLEQFDPLNDGRFYSLDIIKRIWSPYFGQPWAYIQHCIEEAEDVSLSILEIVSMVHRVNNLKAFL